MSTELSKCYGMGELPNRLKAGDDCHATSDEDKGLATMSLGIGIGIGALVMPIIPKSV